MQLRQFIKFFSDDEVFKVVTVDEESDESVTLMNFVKRDLSKIEKYFNSILDCNLNEGDVTIQGGLVIIYV